jgi:Cu+-exporting ATPase
MTCAACVGRVERALRKVPGVSQAQVNLVLEEASIEGTAATCALVGAIVNAGYEAEPATEGQEHEAPPGLPWEFVLAASCTLPLLALTMLPMVSMRLHHAMGDVAVFFMGWGGFALSAPVQFIAAHRFYVQTWSEITHRSLGMSTLVVLGSSAAFGYSLLGLVAPGLFPVGTVHAYFEASSAIIAFVLLGKALEARARGQSSQAIHKLLDLQGKTARVLRGNQEVEIPAAAIVPGDTVLVRAGERIPTDGRLDEGQCFADESMITGEAKPVRKQSGDALVGGTLNGQTPFRFVATRVGKDTVLAQVVRAMQDAQRDKPNAQLLADRIAQVFVPVIIGVACVTFAMWLVLGPTPALGQAVVHAVTVLVVACPCAMGLATPTAIVVATGKAAELGVFLRRGGAFEALAGATLVVFDKTGTLTRGKPRLADFALAPGQSKEHVLKLVACVEAQSEHPLARALVSEHVGPLAAAQSVTVVPGQGIFGDVDGQRVLVGNDALLRTHGVAVDWGQEHAQRLGAQGATPVWVAIAGELVAVLGVADTPKPEARAAVAALKARGLSVLMLTGDAKDTASHVASLLGIEDLVAQASPTDKARVVADRVAQGQRVAFVGDGINDAPALARAHVGIALGTGTDVAKEAGDILLLRGDLSAVVAAYDLSRRTLRTIRRNFVWAYGYNVALVPLAAGAFAPIWAVGVSPALAALAMSASSLFVLGSSLALKRFRPPLLPST